MSDELPYGIDNQGRIAQLVYVDVEKDDDPCGLCLYKDECSHTSGYKVAGLDIDCTDYDAHDSVENITIHVYWKEVEPDNKL